MCFLDSLSLDLSYPYLNVKHLRELLHQLANCVKF